jgi:Prokaryotic E2 family E
VALPESDTDFLTDRGIEHEVLEDGGVTCVLLKSYPLPKGYEVESVDVLIRLKPGYPDVPPDMWWCDPHVRRTDGAEIAQTQVTEQHLGRSWQRWSRHLEPGQWKSGVDGLESFIAVIRREFSNWGLETAA